MKATELSKALAPFFKLINKKAHTASYRALLLTDSFVRGCSAFGVMEIEVELELDADIHVDGDEFLQVLKSLPAAELKLTVDNTKLVWVCGQAKGQLAVLGENIEIPELPDELQPEIEMDEFFSEALAIGSLSAGGAPLMSAGLYGALICNTEDGLFVYGSDDTTVSSARLGETLPDSVEQAVLSPEALALLQVVSDDQGAMLAFDNKAVYCNTASTRLVLNQIAPLRHKIQEIIEVHAEANITAPLDHDTVLTFIKRAEALSSDNGSPFVSISVENGNARLAFESGKNSSEEYYVVEGGADINVPPITVEARRLAKALGYASHLVFDHAEDEALVLKGDHDFIFVLSGKAQE